MPTVRCTRNDWNSWAMKKKKKLLTLASLSFSLQNQLAISYFRVTLSPLSVCLSVISLSFLLKGEKISLALPTWFDFVFFFFSFFPTFFCWPKNIDINAQTDWLRVELCIEMSSSSLGSDWLADTVSTFTFSFFPFCTVSAVWFSRWAAVWLFLFHAKRTNDQQQQQQQM